MASVENVWCGAKLLSRIKSMYLDSSACVRVKGGESKRFRIDSGVYHVPLALQCIYGWSDGDENGDAKEGVSFLEERREWRLPDLLYADGLVPYGEGED